MTAATARTTVLVTSRSFSTGARDLVSELAAAGLDVVRGPATHDLDVLNMRTRCD